MASGSGARPSSHLQTLMSMGSTVIVTIPNKAVSVNETPKIMPKISRKGSYKSGKRNIPKATAFPMQIEIVTTCRLDGGPDLCRQHRISYCLCTSAANLLQVTYLTQVALTCGSCLGSRQSHAFRRLGRLGGISSPTTWATIILSPKRHCTKIEHWSA